MKNLREHFERIADMQDNDMDEQRMLSALIVGAQAALGHLLGSTSYISHSDVIALLQELEPESVVTAPAPVETPPPTTAIEVESEAEATVDVPEFAESPL